MGPAANNTVEAAHAASERGALLMRLHKDIESASILVLEMNSRVSQVADRVFGAEPMPDEVSCVNGTAPEQQSHMAALEEQINRLHNALQALIKQAERFDQLV